MCQTLSNRYPGLSRDALTNEKNPMNPNEKPRLVYVFGTFLDSAFALCVPPFCWGGLQAWRFTVSLLIRSPECTVQQLHLRPYDLWDHLSSCHLPAFLQCESHGRKRGCELPEVFHHIPSSVPLGRSCGENLIILSDLSIPALNS